MAAYIETQSLSKTVFKPTVWKRYMIFFPMGHKYPRHGRFLQIHGTSKLTSPYRSTGYEIYGRNTWHWDNLFRPGCIPRHNIQRKMRKSYHWRKDEFKRKPSSIYIFTCSHPPNVKMDLTNKKPWEPYEQTPLRKYFRFQKAVDGQRLATQFERKIAVRSKIHRRKATLLKQNNKEEKEILPFETQYKLLVSIIKEVLMKKYNLIQNQPPPCQLSPWTYTQNHTPRHGTRGW